MASKSISDAHKKLVSAMGNVQDAKQLEKCIQDLENCIDDSSSGGLSRDKQDVIERDLLEAEALIALTAGDIPKFRARVCSLKQSAISCPQQYHLLGLELMALLSINDLVTFRLSLERIPYDVQSENPYVRTPVELQQNLAVGYYKRIFLAKANMPSPYYAQFFDKLMDTVRADIGVGLSQAYPSISHAKAKQVLMFDGPAADKCMTQFAEKQLWNKDKDRYMFSKSAASACRQNDTGVQVHSLAANFVQYANKIEMIV